MAITPIAERLRPSAVEQRLEALAAYDASRLALSRDGNNHRASVST
jgi:hypothetical protein